MSDISFDDLPSAPPAAADLSFDDIGFDDLPDAAPASGVAQYGKEFGKGIVEGIKNVPAASLKGVAAARSQSADAKSRAIFYNTIDRIKAGEDPAAAAEAARANPPALSPVTESPLWQAAEAIEGVGKEALAPGPGFEGQTWTRDIGSGLGSVGAGIAASMLNPVGAMLMFVTAGQGEAADRAVKAGATPEQIQAAARFGTVAGATDVVDALLPMLGSTGKALGLLKRVGYAAVAGALAEGGQEGLQQFVQNAIAKGVYKPDQDLFEDVPRNAAVGAIVGGGVGGFTGAIERPVQEARAPGTTATDAAPAAAPPSDVDRVLQELDALLSEEVEPAAAGPAPAEAPTTAPAVPEEDRRRAAALPEAEAVDDLTFESLPDATISPEEQLLRDQQAMSEIPPYELGKKIDTAAAESNTEPTEAQKEAGNYKKGHIDLHGLKITIENPRGSERFGIDQSGEPWRVTLPDHYGYIKRTEGADGDQIDVYVGPHPESERVFVVDQKDAESGKFDEHKAMLGYDTPGEALDAYESAFSDGKAPARIAAVTEMSVPEFKNWLREGDTTKPLAQAPRKDEAAAADLREPEPEPRDEPEVVADAERRDRPASETRERDEQIEALRNRFVERMRAKSPGFPADAGSRSIEMMLQAAETGIFNDALRPDNPVSRSLFEDITGVKLPRGVAATKALFKGEPFPVDLRDYEAEGRAAFEAGKPRRTPKEIILAGNRKAEAWARGWDRANLAAPVLEAKPSEKPSFAIDNVSHRPAHGTERTFGRYKGYASTNEGGRLSVDAYGDSPREAQQNAVERLKKEFSERVAKREKEKPVTDKRTLIGKNVKGQKLYEDARGVRSYVDNGIRVTETVSLRPTRDGMEVDVGPRSDEYQTLDEAAPTWAEVLHALPKDDKGRYDLDLAGRLMHEITGKKQPGFNDLSSEQRIEMLRRVKGAAADEKAAVSAAKPAETAILKGEESADADRGRKSVPESAPEIPAGEQPEGAARPSAEGRLGPVSGPRGESGGRTVSDDHRAWRERPESASRLRGEGEASASAPVDSGRDRAGGDREPAAAKQGLSEARKAIAERSKLNYRITDADKIGEGGPKEKVRANIQAIRVLKQIQDDAREPTQEEKAQLVRYVGWGAFAQDVFATHKAEWKTERDALRSLLTDDEYAAARASTLNAHYTSVDVVKGMWDALEHLGFKGGYAIEPSAGVGHFIGLTPNKIAKRTAWTAVELDKITGGILKALYGGSEVMIGGYEEFKRPSNFYDLAISNVPFGNYNLREKPYGSYPIHDFFFVKSLDKVRPGGIVAFITSRYTMDRSDDSTRRMLAKQGDLVGAIRLPGGKGGAFASNAGTEVTTDIIFLRKRIPGEQGIGFDWTGTREIETPDGPVAINEYFADRPEMMLGEMRLQGTMYRANEPVLVGEREGLQERIAKAAALMPADVMAPLGTRATTEPAVTAFDIAGDVKDGAFFEKDGKIFRREAGQGVEPKLSGPDRDKIRRLIVMRDAVNKLLASQATGETAGNADVRKGLRKEYDAFVRKYGPINKEVTVETKRRDKAGDPIVSTRQPNLSAFLKDPDAWKVSAIEVYDRESDTARPAAIFERDILAMAAERAIKGPADALAASLDAKGRVDLEEIARALNLKSPDAVPDVMGDMIYLDPNGRRWVTADEYLSGDVVQKLEDALAAAADDKSLRRNVEALEKVQPAPLTRADIAVPFGAPWVPADVYERFLEEELGSGKARVRRVPITGEWKADVGVAARDAQAKYATDRVSIDKIVNAAMNNAQVTVYDEGPNDTRVVNEGATREARAKTNVLKEAFSGNPDMGTEGWVWKDDDRSLQLEAIYNRTYNNLVPRKFDGSHLTLPGLAAMVTNSRGDVVEFQLRQHQKNAVWRMVQNGNTLLAHVVGAGKTYTMIAGGMEMKRLGIVRKPAYVVPNHMLEQFSREFLQAYPNARLLVAQKDEMTRENRRSFVAKAAANDWDGIIITHDAFGRINVSREFREEFIRDQLNELENIIREEKSEGGKNPTIKELERAKRGLQTRLAALMNEERKDQGVTFEETGIDHVFVDEAHLFKNLQFITRMGRVKGLAQGASQRAEDLFLKTRLLEARRPGRSAVFATGTPVSNTMAEMWTMMRYLELDKLRARGLDVFDAWAQTFGQIVEQMELSADGRTFKEVSSFSKFVNIPELISLYSEVADTQTADMLNLPRPKVLKESGDPGIEIIEAEPSPAEEAYINDLVRRAEEMKGKRPEKGADNMLKIVTEGRKIATDGRLMKATFDFNPLGKVAKATDKIAEIYQEGKEPGMVQVVFLDLGTPKSKAPPKKVIQLNEVEEDGDGDPADAAVTLNLYEDIRQRLVKRGIPQKEIAFIHEAGDDMKKARLFERVRAGDVRVLIGSTGKMGVGTNVQDRLIAMHHIDAPWKPAEVEQRDGRIVRQGNLNPNVRLYRYVTRRSFDAFMWQKLDTKSKFIGQVLSGARGVRSAEDIDNPLPEAAEMKAAATGDPRILEHAELERKVRQLTVQRKAFQSSYARAQWEMQSATERLEQLRGRIGDAKADAAKVVDTSGENFAMTLEAPYGKGKVTDRREAGADVINALSKLQPVQFYQPRLVDLGKISGFTAQLELAGRYADGEPRLFATPYLKGKGSYTRGPEATFIVTPEADPMGLVRKYENLLRQVAAQPEQIEYSIGREEENIKRLQDTLAQKAWPRDKELNAAQAKLAELTAALRAKGEKPAEQAAPEEDGQEVASLFDARTDLTPRAQESRPLLERTLTTLIRRIAGDNVNVAFPDTIPIPDRARKAWGKVAEGKSTAGGTYMPAHSLIKIALYDPQYRGLDSTALHESFHAVEHMLLTDREMRVLRKAEPELRNIVEGYAEFSPAQTAALADYEVRAIAFEAYATARANRQPVTGFPAAVRVVFDRLRTVLERIRNALNGLGFKAASDVFSDVYEGKMAARAPVSRQFGGAKYDLRGGAKIDPIAMSRFLRGEIGADELAPDRPNWAKVQDYIARNFNAEQRERMGAVFDSVLAGNVGALDNVTDKERAVVEKLLDQVGGKPPAPPADTPPPATGGGGDGARRRILDRIVPSDKNQKRLPTLNQAYTMAKDDLNPLRVLRNELAEGNAVPVDEDPYALARLSRGAFGKAEQMLENGTFSFRHFANTGKGLKPILKPVADDLDGFRAYMAARRTLELANRGIKTGIRVSDAVQVARRGHNKYGRPFTELVAYQRRVLDYLRDAGVVSPKAYAAMVEANKDYVPFFRLIENEVEGKNAIGRNLKVRDPIKGIKGSTREIIDPIESIIKNTYLYIALAEKNRALLALDDLAASSPRGEEFLRKPKRGVHPITVSEQEVAKFLDDHGLDPEQAEAFTIFRPNAFRPEPDQIAFFRNGKREVRQVDPDVADAVNAMDRESVGLLLRVLATPARLLRLGATQAPEFIVRNPIRDQITAMVFSEHGYVPVYDFVLGLGSILRNDAQYQTWLKAGGGNSALVSMDRKYIESEVMKLSNPTIMGTVKNVVKSPIDFLRMLSELAENATRVGEFRRAVKKGKSPMEAAFSAREVTLDFARIGTQMRAVNALIPFFNASVEGTDREIRGFAKRPLASSLKVAAAITLPSILLWFANHDDERYDEIPRWQKDLFWLVFTRDNVWRIPKPFALGVLFGSVPERMLDAFFGKKPAAFKNLHKTVVDAFLPNMIPAFMAPAIEQFANRSTFTERPIVPKYLEDVLPQHQYAPYTSETAKILGRTIARIPGMDQSSFASPMVLDNYVRAWTGGLGQYAVATADKALRATGAVPSKVQPTLTAADTPVLKAFAVRHPSGGAQSIQDFYDTYEERKKALRSVRYLTKLGDRESAASISEARNLETAERIHKALGQQMKFARDVWFNNDMTAEDKRRLIDSTYLRAIEIAKMGNRIFRETEEAKKRSKETARRLEAAQ